MALFSKKNSDSKRVDLYVPEVFENDKYSKWRKPEAVYLDDPRALKKHSAVLEVLFNFSNIINLVLALIIMVGLVRLMFFTDFERVVFDDSTYLSCIVEPDGSISSDF